MFPSSLDQQATENNQLRFNYDVLLHEMVSQVTSGRLRCGAVNRPVNLTPVSSHWDA